MLIAGHHTLSPPAVNDADGAWLEGSPIDAGQVHPHGSVGGRTDGLGGAERACHSTTVRCALLSPQRTPFLPAGSGAGPASKMGAEQSCTTRDA